MKKLLLLIFTVLITVTAIHAQNGWVDCNFGDRMTVKLPSPPHKYGQGSQQASTKDSTVCIVTMVDLKATANLDSAGIAALLPTADFAAQLRSGMFGQMEGFVQGDVKTGKWNGNYSYNIEGNNASKKLKTYTFMVVVGCNLYALNCLVPYGISSKDKETFFASLKMK